MHAHESDATREASVNIRIDPLMTSDLLHRTAKREHFVETLVVL